MRKRIFLECIFLCCVLVIFIAAVYTPVYANEGRRLHQTYSIEIEVECLDTAMTVVRELNGYNLSSAVFMFEPWWDATARRATFARRVDEWAFRHVQEVLRGLGDVTNETEQARHLEAEFLDVEVRLRAVNQEIERLTARLAASTYLNTLIAVDNHLSHVMRDRDSLIGWRNLLNSQASGPVLNITLVEIPEERPAPTPDSFGSRISVSFLDSWNTAVRNAGNFIVFLARVAIPAVIWAVILSLVGFVCFRMYKRFLKNRTEAGSPVEIEAIKDGEENEA